MTQFKIEGLAHIGIPTANLAATIVFYQQLGFIIEQQNAVVYPKGITEIAFMSAGNAVLEFYQEADHTQVRQSGAVDHFALKVNDLSETLKHLQHLKIPLLVEPTIANGVQYIIIEGPNGEKIEFDYFL